MLVTAYIKGDDGQPIHTQAARISDSEAGRLCEEWTAYVTGDPEGALGGAYGVADGRGADTSIVCLSFKCVAAIVLTA